MDKNIDLKKELTDLSTSFGKISAEFTVLAAKKPQTPPKSAPDPDNDAQNDMMDMMRNHMNNHMNDLHDRMSNMHQNIHAAIENVHQRVDKLANLHYTHSSIGHPPALNPSQMAKFLKSVGAEGDHTILKPSIQCKADYVEAEYIKPSK